MQKKTSIAAGLVIVVLSATALYQYRENQRLAELQDELAELRAELAAQEGMFEQERQGFARQIQSLELNLASATVQISNLSSALQDARENYFSDLEASREVIEAETGSAN